MANTTKLRREHDGKVEEAHVMIWNGVRIMRGAPSPDGPQGSFEVIDLAGDDAQAEAVRRIDALLAEGFHEIVPEAAPPRSTAAEVVAPRAPQAPSRARPVTQQPLWKARALGHAIEKQLPKLKATIKKAGLAHRSAEVEALAKPGIDFGVKKAKASDLKAVVSRIGGPPDLPSGAIWPEVGGVPLAFVAQIVIADVADDDLEGLLPASGVLSFFAQLDSSKADYGEVGVVLLHSSSAKLERAAPAASLFHANAGLLTPKPRLTVPPSEGSPAEDLALEGEEASDYHDNVFLGPIPEGRHHMLLGWPTAATQHGIAGKRFLAQLDSDHRIAFEMGDYETLRFYIDGDTVDQKTLKSAVCTLSEA